MANEPPPQDPLWLGVEEGRKAIRDCIKVPTGRRIELRVPGLTLERVGRLLVETREIHGVAAARQLATRFEYLEMVGLAQRWLANPEQTINDPNRHIPPRLLLLPGMSDEELARHQPDAPEAQDAPILEMTTALSQLLQAAGEGALPPRPVYDEEVLDAYLLWNERLQG